MGNGLTLVGLLPLLIACGGKTERSLDLERAPGSDSSYGGGSDSVAGSAPRSAPPDEEYGDDAFVGPEPKPDGELPACTAAPLAKPTARLPPTSPVLSGPATVLAATADGLELGTAGGVEHFGWVGPSVAMLFAPSEVVEVSSFWNWSETPDDWHLVESESVLLATLAGSWPLPLSPEPGWDVGPLVPIGFPSLDFLNLGCCQRAGISECDYSDLRATLGDQIVHIPRGTTGQLRGWSITNLGAVWEDYYLFTMAVTLIGPARHFE